MERNSVLPLNTAQFVEQLVAESSRLDGRDPLRERSLSIGFGCSYGSVYVELGRTKVAVQVTCEAVAPRPDFPNDGFYLFETELSPMAALEFERGQEIEQRIELGRIIERGLRESRAIDTEALCIASGRKVWGIRIRIHVLDHYGNMIDCASIATITALMHFRRPDVSVVGDEIKIFSLEERPPVPLSIHHMPVSVTFALFSQGTTIFVDPTLEEEKCMEGRMTITMNSQEELCAIQKGGSIPIDVSTVMQCIRIASVKVHEITETIRNALDSYEEAIATAKPFLLFGAKEEMYKGGVTQEDDMLVSMASDSDSDDYGKDESNAQDPMKTEPSSGAESGRAEVIGKKDTMGLGLYGSATNAWDSDGDSGDVVMVRDGSRTAKDTQDAMIVEDDDRAGDDSEEEDVVVLGGSSASDPVVVDVSKPEVSATEKKSGKKKKKKKKKGAVDLSVAIKKKKK